MPPWPWPWWMGSRMRTLELRGNVGEERDGGERGRESTHLWLFLMRRRGTAWGDLCCCYRMRMLGRVSYIVGREGEDAYPLLVVEGINKEGIPLVSYYSYLLLPPSSLRASPLLPIV